MALTEAQRAYQAQWRAKNREKLRVSSKKWRDSHPEKAKEAKRRYYEANKEKIRESNAAWRASNREKWAEYQRRFYDENPDLWKSYRKRFYEANRGALIERERRRRGVIRGAANLSPAEKAEIEGFYVFCRIFPEFEVDHIVPLRHKRVTGLHVPCNLQVLPRIENRRKLNSFKET